MPLFKYSTLHDAWIVFTLFGFITEYNFTLDFPQVILQLSSLIVSDSLWSHELQHTRPPCPLPTPGIHSNSRPSSQWGHLAISSSVVPFSSCPQSLPASKSSLMSQPFSWGGQSTGVILYWCFSFWFTSLCIIGSSYIYLIRTDQMYSF